MNRFSRLLAPILLTLALLAAAAHAQAAWDQQKATDLASSLTESLANLENVVANDPQMGQEGITGGQQSLRMSVTTLHEEAMGLSEALSNGQGRDATKNRVGNLRERFDDLQVMVGKMFEQGDFADAYGKTTGIFGQLEALYGRI
jgi:prephenate dehydrogenase